MAVVKRIFRMVGTEGVAIRGVKRIFEREGLPTPEGKKIWGQFFIREAIKDDAYRPHSWNEIERLVAKDQMAAEVASRLDPQKPYVNRSEYKTPSCELQDLRRGKRYSASRIG
jgi:site-specific DNA recombinase